MEREAWAIRLEGGAWLLNSWGLPMVCPAECDAIEQIGYIPKRFAVVGPVRVRVTIEEIEAKDE